MNILFLAALVLYLIVFITIGIFDSRRNTSFADYSAAGRRQGSFAVVMTLLATIVGASTTIGLTDTVYKIGFPGVWWLVSGAAGLVLQSVFLSEKVRGLNAVTLPDLAGKTVGRSAELIIAAVIVVSWVGVVAGQLVALNSLVTFALGKSSTLCFVLVSVIVIAYTSLGGQMSVVKTDKVQLFIILLGMLLCVSYFYFAKGDGSAAALRGIELFNKNYTPMNLLVQFFVIGGVYFLGPDIISRNFISRDGATAKKAALVTGIALLFYAAVIGLIGMWLRSNVSAEMLGGRNALMYAVSVLPKPLAFVMVFALFSAVLSSTDTCIINASAIFVKDILKKESVFFAKLTVVAIGVLALALALWGRSDIMALLTGAYSFYTPGVIFPLTIAILAYQKRGLNLGLWLSAVVAGGLFGLLGTYFKGALSAAGVPLWLMQYLPLMGMGVSLVLSVLSVMVSNQRGCSAES